MAEIGHNSEAAHRFAKDHLKAFVERIERLNEERKALSDDVSDVYKEAKANGFDHKALKIVIQRRAKDSDAVAELDAIVETYEAALGTAVATRARAGEPEPRPAPIKQRLPDAPASSPPDDGLDIPDYLDRRKRA